MSHREVGLEIRRSWRLPWRNREFVGLALAQILSQWGDQIARVAVASLVLSTTGSAAASATVFAVSLVPQVFGLPLLGPYADRLPRRGLSVICDLAQALLVGVLVLFATITDHPTVVVVLLLIVLIELAGTPASSASSALQVDIFDGAGAAYLQGQRVLQILSQIDQVIGLALGGAAVALLGLDGALWADLISFVLSALLILVLVRPRPAAAQGGAPGIAGLWLDVRVGLGRLASQRPLRMLLWLSCISAIGFVAPEAVALPYAMAHGGGTAEGGLMLAAVPLGAVISVVMVGRWSPDRQVARILPLAALCPLPLIAAVGGPSWPIAAGLWLLCGTCQGFMVPLMSTFMMLTPPELRGRLGGFAGATFAVVTAGTFLGCGVLADERTPQFAVAVAGSLSLALVAATVTRWPRAELRREATRVYAPPVNPAHARPQGGNPSPNS